MEGEGAYVERVCGSLEKGEGGIENGRLQNVKRLWRMKPRVPGFGFPTLADGVLRHHSRRAPNARYITHVTGFVMGLQGRGVWWETGQHRDRPAVDGFFLVGPVFCNAHPPVLPCLADLLTARAPSPIESARCGTQG